MGGFVGKSCFAFRQILAGETGSLSYQAVIKSAAKIPGGRTLVSNTVLLDPDQTPPIGAEAEIEVTGDIIPPLTTASTTTVPNAAGWFNTDVTLIVAAPFTTADLAVAAEVHRGLAQKIAYCFRKMGVWKTIGKRQRSWLYQPTTRRRAA